MQTEDIFDWGGAEVAGPVVGFALDGLLLCHTCRDEYRPTFADLAEIFEADADGHRPVFQCPRCRRLPAT